MPKLMAEVSHFYWRDSEKDKAAVGRFMLDVIDLLKKEGKAKVYHEWWKHPWYRRGTTSWVIYLDNLAYDIMFSQHETPHEFPAGEIDYEHTLYVNKISKETADKIWERHLEVKRFSKSEEHLSP